MTAFTLHRAGSILAVAAQSVTSWRAASTAACDHLFQSAALGVSAWAGEIAASIDNAAKATFALDPIMFISPSTFFCCLPERPKGEARILSMIVPVNAKLKALS
jgi:hypothetical protein